MLKIRLLGRLEVRLHGSPVEIASRPAQALLAYLALHAGIPQRREKLAGLLWPEASEENARTYLRQALWRVRKALGGRFLSSDRMTVSLEPEADFSLDTAVLEAEPEEGWSVEALMAVVSAYEGELLPGFYDEWVVLERGRLEAIHGQRLEHLLSLLVEDQRWDDVRTWGERWIATGQVPEAAYRALMLAHAASGDLAGVAAAYQRGVQALQAEIGVLPSAETQALYQRLVKGEAPDPPVERTSSPSQTKLQPSRMPEFLQAKEGTAPIRQELFIGRERELALLADHLKEALAGRGRAVFITGEAGRGKTSLLQEFARVAQAAHPNLIVASGACPVYTPVCAPYGLFRAVLEMLTGDIEPALAAGAVSEGQALRLWQLLPDALEAVLLHGPNLVDALVPAESLLRRLQATNVGRNQLEQLQRLAARASTGGSRLSDQGDLFTEYADVLGALSTRRPLLLILDDLHWADASSIGLLGQLGHRLGTTAILLIAAYRPEDVSQGREGAPHPLGPVLSEYKRRYGEIALALDEEAAKDERAFVDALLDSEPNRLGEDFRQTLARHTGGHPLFTIELLREMQARGVLLRDEKERWATGQDFTWDVMPPRVEGVIETRLNRLEPELRQWLQVASVEGEIFTAEVIGRVQGYPDREVVRRLSAELDRQHRLVVAGGVHRKGTVRLSNYRFRHNLFRQYLYAHLDEIERSYLHEQVGFALEELYGTQAGDIADRLAHHFQEAGVAHRALPYLLQAGMAAARAYAYEEAITFFSQALNLARQAEDHGLEGERLVELFLQLGRTLEHHSDFAQALAVYREMEDWGQAHGLPHITLRALSAQGTLYAIPSPVHDPERALAIAEAALPLAQDLEDRAAEARIFWIMMFACEYGNQLSKAIEYGERSLALARELDLVDQLAYTLNDLGGCYWVSGQITKGIELFRESIDLRRATENLPMLADSLHSASIALSFAGEYDEALAFSEEAWQISKAIGNKWGLVQTNARLGFVYRERGEPGQGIALTQESLQQAQAYGLQHEYIQPITELAFTYARLGAGELGREQALRALEASHRQPAYRPYLLAALAECQLVLGNQEEAAAIVQQAREDPYWQAFPAYGMALILAEGRLALAKKENRRALQIAQELAADLRQSGIRSFLPAALDLGGQALLADQQGEEARALFLEAQQEAEAMNARDSLWLILLHLSQTEPEVEKAEQLREQAREIAQFIADHAGSPELRQAFMDLPEVQLLFGPG